MVGNEANGIGESVLSRCDTLVQIPMAGAAESLNAAVAASVLLYEHYRQNNELL